MSMQSPRRPGHVYWFPARRYGWGWGLPQSWQGWLVLDAYLIGIAGLILFCFLLNSHLGFKSLLYFLFLSGILTGCLIVICYIKGEPPSWRWGR
jgi:hypothetical protein